MMTGIAPVTTPPGSSDVAPFALEVSQAEASPFTTQVGPVLREDSEPETCGRVCAAAGSAAVRSVPAVSTLIIQVRTRFSPFHSGGEGALAALRLPVMNAPVVPQRPAHTLAMSRTPPDAVRQALPFAARSPALLRSLPEVSQVFA